MAGRGKSDDPEHPSEPGWYPDPWSATGEGERYYDGKKWGTTTKPLARHSPTATATPASVTSISSKRRSKRRSQRTDGVRGSWARFKHTYGPLALLVLAIAVVWAIPKLRSHHAKSQMTNSSTVPAIAAARPPAGTDEAATPIGKPAAVPAGAGKYEFLRHQTGEPTTPVAFDPCRPIHYVVNPQGAPADGLALIRSAIARVHTATGLEFIDDGTTTERADKQRPTYLPERYNPNRWAPVLVSWSDETAFPPLAGYVAGTGQAQDEYVDPTAATNALRLVYVTGQVTLDRRDLSIAKMPDRAVAEAIVLHEFGHLVGLDHTSDQHQIMYSEAQFNVRDFGVGDLRGLAKLGTQQCYPGV